MDTPGECLDSVRCRTGPVGALTAPQTSPSQRRCGRVLSCKQGHEPHDASEPSKLLTPHPHGKPVRESKAKRVSARYRGAYFWCFLHRHLSTNRHMQDTSHTSCCQHLLQQGLNMGQNSCTWCCSAVCIWIRFAHSSKWRWGLSSTAGIRQIPSGLY